MEYVKLLHLLFIMIWVGNLLALTRLLGYRKTFTPEAFLELLPVLRRMYLFVGLPSLVMGLLFGMVLLTIAPLGRSLGWLHLKLTASALLIGIDLLMGAALEKGVTGKALPSVKSFKLYHGGVGLLVITALFSVLVLHGKDKSAGTQVIASQKIEERLP